MGLQVRIDHGNGKRAVSEPLLRSGWLSRQPAAFQDEIIARGGAQVFEPGSPVYLVGGPPGGIYGLIRGVLSVSTAPRHAAPRFIQFGIVGAWAGEGPFLTGEPRRAELIAIDECLMWHLPLDAMQQMAARDPEAIRRFAQITVGHFDVLARVIDDLLIPQAERRIASVLNRTAWLVAPTVPISQADLGAMANASRKQVNAALARFAARGWIEHSYRAIRVLDTSALLHFASGDEGAVLDEDQNL